MRCFAITSSDVAFVRRWAIQLLIVCWTLCHARVGIAQALPHSGLPPEYIAKILPPTWRTSFPLRSAFGSLCPPGPLPCAVIDRPFAFAARVELMVRPKASDGSTGLLIPFSFSVPLFGRAEVGMGSCYATHWIGKDDRERNDMRIDRPAGLCPLWLAGKFLLWPWLSDVHASSALALEYLVEQQVGPLGGLNQLGLSGAMSRVSLAHRKPLGSFEVSGAATVLVDHVSRAGALQLGGHVGYRLPIGEHILLFAQGLLQMPNWGPLVVGVSGETLSLAGPPSGTLVVGAQQLSNFGLRVGFAVMWTKSAIDERATLLFDMSPMVNPRNKPWHRPREAKPEPLPKAEIAIAHAASQEVCAPGYLPAASSSTPQCVRKPPPECVTGTHWEPPAGPDGTWPVGVEPVCVAIPLPPPPHPFFGDPCDMIFFDGQHLSERGTIDTTGKYCVWGSLRLPLGAVVSPPHRRAEPLLPEPVAPPALIPAAPPVATKKFARKPHAPINSLPQTSAIAQAPLAQPTKLVAPSQRLAKHPPHEAEPDDAPHYDPAHLSVQGSPLASGFVDKGKHTLKQVKLIGRAIKAHGVGVVVPSKEDIVEWYEDVKTHCLNDVGDCAVRKADEAADNLNQFLNKSRDEQIYTAGSWAFDSFVEAAAGMALPGGGMLVGGITKQGEKAAAKKAAKAAAKKVGKEAAEEAGEEVVEHVDEAAAKRLLKQLEEKAAKDAEEKAEREAKEKVGREARWRAEREAEEKAEPWRWNSESPDGSPNDAGDVLPKGGTYTLRDKKTGEVVRSGRTNNFERRKTEHQHQPETKGHKFSDELMTDDLAEQRGHEQMLHDQHQPRLNKIRPISPKNPRRDEYIEAAKRKLEGSGS